MAAFNIGSQTIHSGLGLRVVDRTADGDTVIPNQATALQMSWAGTLYIIIDEKSMVGPSTLARVDQQLQLIFPTHRDQPFGGQSVLFVGDFGQLPPVGEPALFSSRPSLNQEHIWGMALYPSFTESITLDVVMRQNSSDTSAVQFRDLLAQLRNCDPQPQDYELLSARFWSQLTPTERSSFDAAIYLCPMCESVTAVNIETLHHSRCPVLMIPA